MKTEMKSILGKLADLIQEATKILESINKCEISRTEREFKNEDFHIKVWETDDEIGGRTFFVREEFLYRSKKTLDSMPMSILSSIETKMCSFHLPDFGMARLTSGIKKSKIKGYTFQDIVKALETAHNESLEAHSKKVTIEDVIKELESVDTVEERWEILDKYEVVHPFIRNWLSLDKSPTFIDAPNVFKLGFYELRKREVK